jgi:Alpha-L-fucosidase
MAFEANWDSLEEHRCPEWLRDAKFGIWAHWGPQSVPEFGDWYARFMYGARAPLAFDWEGQFTERFVPYHREKYGHPADFGYKDICNEWKAERWEPGRLMDLYKRAGARYFVALANHHDNFDCWDSRYHEWNSSRVGPKRDVVGIWAKEARRAGLRFGVSVHAARSWEWFEPSRGCDAEGPRAGLPYDGALGAAAGAGTWWNGLDPAALYGKPHEHGDPPDAAYIEDFRARTMDLIDSYGPDFIYFDDGAMPFGDTGLRLLADYYNASAALHSGACEATATISDLANPHPRALTTNVERGLVDSIRDEPWHACTCLGNWFYVKGMEYKSAYTVVASLVDVASKNGSLLLSVPQRGDGSIDEREETVLSEIAAWFDVNGEAIYGTRPWKVSGEGPTLVEPGSQKEKAAAYTSEDIRFTQKGDALYAIPLALPADGRLAIRSLAAGSALRPEPIRSMRLLGYDGRIEWSRESSALELRMPIEPHGLPVVCLEVR